MIVARRQLCCSDWMSLNWKATPARSAAVGCLDCVGQLPGDFEQLEISPGVAGMHTCDLLAHAKHAVNCSDCAGAICWLSWFAQVEQTGACRTAVVLTGCRSGMLLWLRKTTALALQMRRTDTAVVTYTTALDVKRCLAQQRCWSCAARAALSKANSSTQRHGA